MAILARFKIQGHSMLPILKPSQEIIISSIPYFFTNPKPGDIVAFENSGKYIVKRIKASKPEGYEIEGDNRSDSKNYGVISKKDIIGKVIYVLS